MTRKEVSILNSLVTHAAENIPGGLNSEEQEVAHIVGLWAIDGVPVRQVCPHCGSPIPRGEGRVEFLEDHVDSTLHRWKWDVKRLLKF